MSRGAGQSQHSRRAGRRLKSDINVVPYIDVMMVLLVIFMVTAPMLAPGVIDLPSVSKVTASPALAIEVVLQKDATLRLIDRDATRLTDVAVSMDELAKLTAQRMRAGEDRPVVIAADKGVLYEQVIAVMDTLKRAGIARVGLSVRPAPL